MKRLSLLFSLLLLCVGVAVADYTPTAETPTVGEKYVLKVVSWGSNTPSSDTYLNATGIGSRIKLISTTTEAINNSLNEYTITLASSSSVSGAYNIKINNLYIPSFTSGASGSFNPVTGKGSNYDIVNKLVKVEGGYKIQNCFPTNNVYAETGYVKVNSAGTELQVTSNADDALIVTFEKIITINYTDNKNNNFSRNYFSSAETIDPSVDFYTNFSPTTITLNNDAQTYSVTCDQNYPFEEGKFYKMSIRGTEDGAHNITWAGSSNIATRSNKTENLSGYWTFEHVNNTENQIKIYTNARGHRQALTYSGSNDGTSVTVAGIGVSGTAFIMRKISGGAMRLANIASDNVNINDYGGSMKFWNNANSKTEAGCAINLYEATTNLPTSITTFKVTDENNITTTLTAPANVYWLDGTNANSLYLDYATCNTATIEDNNTLNITYTNNYPFEVSTADNKKWCYLKLRNDDTHYQLVNGTATKSNDNTVNRSSLSSIRTYNENQSAQWAFVKVENEFNRFKIYNRSDETKVLYLSARNNKTDLTLADENTTSGFTSFYINPQPNEFTDFTGGFTMKPDKDETHAIGDHNNGVLAYWSDRGSSELNDNGSIFRVVDLTTDCVNCINATPAITYIGAYSQATRSTLTAATSVTDFFTKYDKLTDDSYVAPSTTKYYRIQANRYSTPVYMSFDNATANKEGEVQLGYDNTPDERKLGFSQTASTNNLVCFENVANEEGKYYIKDANSGFYYGAKSDNGNLYLVKNSEYAGKYSITYSLNGNVAQVGLKENKASDITSQYLNCSGSDANAAVGDNNYVKFTSPYTDNAETGTTATVDAGCVYQIAEVSTYPLTISAAKYASLCLPFSVTLPEGLTAYKVTSVTNGTDNREMDLAAIDGAIPANEPVIIGATAAGSFNLTINTDNTASQSTDNWLTGATVKRTGIDEDYFALGYKALNSDDADTKTVGFFRVTTTNMPANKAYLLKSKIQESAANPAMVLMFNFGNVTTNINNANTNETEESNTYYDLNGRRVLYPTHGVYVKGNGQKVFIK